MAIHLQSAAAGPLEGISPQDGRAESSDRMTQSLRGGAMVRALIARRGGPMRSGEGKLTTWQRSGLRASHPFPGHAMADFAASGGRR
jgi:hypothetical protein